MINPHNNIYFVKLPMTHPHHFFNGNTPYGYPYNLMPMTYQPNLFFNPSNPFQFSPYPNQIAYIPAMPQERIFNPYQMYGMAPMMNSVLLENPQQTMLKAENNKNGSMAQKMKNIQKRSPPEIIQILQEDYQANDQKDSQKKNLTTTSKSTQKQQFITQKSLPQKSTTSKKQLIRKEQEKTIKVNKNSVKCQEKVEKSLVPRQVVIKHKPIRKAEINLNQKAENKRIILSKRIIQKLENKQEPYKLNKKDRQLYQISFLRQNARQVMTGPQFQAKLPQFILQKPYLQQYISKKKQNLLLRLYRQDEQSQ